MYLKGNKEFEVLRLYLGDYLRRFYLREISKMAGLPLKTTQRILENLEKGRILKSEVRGKNKYFSLNLDNIETKNFLLQAEAFRSTDFVRRYPLFKLFLKETKGSVPLIVFGSFASLSADKNSDVDILVVARKKTEIPSHLLPNKIHEINLSEDNFVKAFRDGEVLIRKIEENHVILNNHSFFVNLMWEKYAK